VSEDLLAAVLCDRHRADMERGARYAEGTCLHCLGEGLEADREGERALLREMVRRLEAATAALSAGLRQNDRAAKGYRQPLDRAWADHAGPLIDLGNWLDAEIDKRFTPAPEAAGRRADG
jgi:hypothetical protein